MSEGTDEARGPRRERWVVRAGAALFVLASTLPLWTYYDLAARRLRWTGPHHAATDDWRAYVQKWEAARLSLVRYGELPTWNPFHCGGVVALQDPEAPFPGVPFLLTFAWLPAVYALKLVLLAHLYAAALGAAALARDAGGRVRAQLFAAVTFSGCGFFGWHFGGGHVGFAAFALAPWALWLARRMSGDARYALGLAALLASTVLAGATYPAPLLALLVALDGAVTFAGRPSERRGLARAWALLGALAPTLAAVRLLPVLAYLRQHPRAVPLDAAVSPRDVLLAFTAHAPPAGPATRPYVWNEYGCYVGVLPLALFVAGAVVAVARRDERTFARRRDLALFAALLTLALGPFARFAPYALLHELPVFGSLRVPSRYLVLVTLAGTLLAVHALVALREVLAARGYTGPGARRAAAVALVALGLDLGGTMALRIQPGVDLLPPAGPPSPRFFHETPTLAMLLRGEGLEWLPARGLGTLHCYVPLHWRPAPLLRHGDVPQALFAGQGQLVVPTYEHWSPQRLVLTAPGLEGTLAVNQNYEEGWSSSAGEVFAYADPGPARRRSDGQVEGVLAVRVPAGVRRVELVHRAPYVRLGALVSLAALLACAALARALRPRAARP